MNETPPPPPSQSAATPSRHGSSGRRRRRRGGRRRRSLLSRLPWRRLFAALALGVVALVLTGLVLILTVDIERYKPAIVDAVATATGREFAIAGEIRLQPSFTPTLIVENVSLGNPDWASRRDFLRIERLEARVRLGPLLRHRLEIVRFALHGAELALERDGARTSWQFAPRAAATAPRGDLPALSLEQVRLENITVTLGAGPAALTTFRIAWLNIDATGPDKPLLLHAEASHEHHRIDIAGRLGALRTLTDDTPYPLEIRANYRDLRLETNGTLADPVNGRGLDLAFSLESPSLDALGRLLGRRLAQVQRPRLHGRLRDDAGGLLLDPLALELGPSQAGGHLRLTLDRPRPLVEVSVRSPYFDLETFGTPRTGAPRTTPHGVPAVPLPVAWLDAADAVLEAEFEAVRGGDVDLDDLELNAHLDDGVLEITRLALRLGDGAANAALRVDAPAGEARLVGRLALTAVPMTPLVSHDWRRAVRGGRVDLDFEFAGTGPSLAAVAASSEGHLHARVADLEITDRMVSVAEGDVLLGLLASINPLAAQDDRVHIECAVANFPLHAGRFESATGLGLRTRKLRVLGGGRIQLPGGELDLGVDAAPRAGLGLNLATFADFVRIGGTLEAPRTTTDAAGMATAGVRAGAALATGGLSLLAEGVLDRAGEDVDVCAIAAGMQAPPGAGASQRAASAARRALDTTAQTLEQAGAAVREGLQGLFGR